MAASDDVTADGGVWTMVGGAVLNVSKAFVAPTAQSIITTVGVLFGIGITIYILFHAYKILFGSGNEPYSQTLLTLCKIAIIAMISLNAGNFQKFVQYSISGLQAGIVAALLGTNMSAGDPASSLTGGTDCDSVLINGPDGDSLLVYKTLDTMTCQGVAIAGFAFDQSNKDPGTFVPTVSSFKWFGMGVATIAVTILVSVGAGSNIILANFMLIILFAIGPLFVACLMFPWTAKYFHAWFAQAITYTFVIVLMSMVMTFAVSLMLLVLNPLGQAFHDPSVASTPPVGGLVGLIVCGIVLSVLMKNMHGLASALAGGTAHEGVNMLRGAANAMRLASGVSGAVAGLAKGINKGANGAADGVRNALGSKNSPKNVAARSEAARNEALGAAIARGLTGTGSTSQAKQGAGK